LQLLLAAALLPCEEGKEDPTEAGSRCSHGDVVRRGGGTVNDRWSSIVDDEIDNVSISCKAMVNVRIAVRRSLRGRHNSVRLIKVALRCQKPSAVSLERRSLGSAVEMEDLVHDLPLAIQLQQREHVCEARPRPVVDFQAHVRDRANDVDF
jgi:hypothetical protein